MGRLRRELAGVRLLAAQCGSSGLDDHHLHPQAEAQVGDALSAGQPRSLDLSLEPSLAEAAGHDDAVHASQRTQIAAL